MYIANDTILDILLPCTTANTCIVDLMHANEKSLTARQHNV
jgi:hypothetical protein